MPEVPPSLAVPAHKVVELLTRKLAERERDLAVAQVQLGELEERLSRYEQALPKSVLPLTAVE